MTNDELHDRFDAVTGGEELDDLRPRQPEPLLRRVGQALVVVGAIVGVLAVVWLVVHIAIWAGEHGMLPAPN